MASPTAEGNDNRGMLSVAAVVIALFAVVVAAVAAVGAISANTDDTVTAAAEPMTVDVVAKDLFFEPDSVEVPAGTDLTVELANEGAQAHDLKLEGGPGSAVLESGQSETVELGTIDEDTVAFCSIPGHREAGMELTIETTGAAGAGTSGGDATAAGHGQGSGGAGAEIDFTAEPGPDWEPFDPELEPAPGGTEHEITMVATEERHGGRCRESPRRCGPSTARFPGPILRGQGR
ncbi:MAG: cupredoxin domain-containing protein [Acidimicrobiia bacterium]|nr:cupredoxin domain-containing protein [Acidimicrobiia bacterium]